jgi:nucleotide-binding universal stress UspA family protein
MNTPWLPKHRVVVPLDFSDASFQLLRKVRESFVDSSQAIHVVHVLPHLEPHDPAVVWGNVDNSKRAEHAKESIRKRVADADLGEMTVHIGFGSPGHEVTDYAKKIGADLIVMAPKRTGTFERILLGSVAERIARYAQCPVLIFREG